MSRGNGRVQARMMEIISAMGDMQLDTYQLAAGVFGTDDEDGVFHPAKRLTPSQLASTRRVIAEFTRMGWLYRVGSRNGRALWANDTPLNTTMRQMAKATATLPG